MSDAREAYSRLLEARIAATAALQRRERTLSLIRLAAIAAAIGAAFIALWWGTAAGIALFVALVVVHDRTIHARRRAQAAAAFYERGLARLSDRWTGTGIAGDRYLEEHHPFAADLDLFGRGSLYELLCTAVTQPGQDLLARWLAAPPPPREEIEARQQAVAELATQLEFREAMAVAGTAEGKGIDLAGLTNWAAAPSATVARGERIAAIIVPLVTTTAVILTLTPLAAWMINATHPEASLHPGLLLPVWVVVASLAVQLLLARRLGARVGGIVGGIERAEEALEQFAHIVGVIEPEQFESARMREITARVAGGTRASSAIDSLRKRVALLDARRNQFFAPFALLLMWTTNVALLIEQWRRRHGGEVISWLEAAAETEALSSLAAFSFENPGFAFPAIDDTAAVFEATELGHPLIPAARRVCNDVSFGNGRQLLVVSGSNMSGKSTMLRSVGVAAVLAFAGAPVCAHALRTARMSAGASIRINDSLQEGSSRFYAEILRLRQILGLAEGDGPLLFLLDEILNGTNSHDRRIGAEAVVRRLVEVGAIGLVTTHDLALAAIAESLSPHAANVHFEDHIEEGRMIFDYRMKPGVVEKSNALELMRSVGIEV